MAILIKGTDFTDGDQVTAAKLDALVDSATFNSGAVDASTTALSGGAIIVKDLGVTAAKLETATNGQLMIGNGTGFTKAALTAGTNIAVTNASGAVTLGLTGTVAAANGGTGASTLTANNVLLGNGTSAVQFVAPSTSGNLLTSDGTTWQSTAPTASSAITLLSTVTASSSATVDVETTFDSTYDAYMLVVSGARPASDSVSLQARMKIGGSYITTSTYISTGGYSSTAGNQATALATEITLVSSVWGSDSASSCDIVMYVFNPSSTAFKKQIRYEATSLRLDTGATQIQTRSGVGSNDNIAALTGIRFLASSGNIAAGKFRLYGIANS